MENGSDGRLFTPERVYSHPKTTYSHRDPPTISEPPHPICAHPMSPFSKTMSQNAQNFARVNPQPPPPVKVVYFLYNTPTVTPQALPEITTNQLFRLRACPMHLKGGCKHPNTMIPLRPLSVPSAEGARHTLKKHLCVTYTRWAEPVRAQI